MNCLLLRIWLRRLLCVHDWRCCNTEDMLHVTAATVRFRCAKCGKVEGL